MAGEDALESVSGVTLKKYFMRFFSILLVVYLSLNAAFFSYHAQAAAENLPVSPCDAAGRRLPIGEGLSLVVGSNRAPVQLTKVFKEFHNPLPGKGDFTHKDTFGGRATTLDLKPRTPGTERCSHIKQDVLVFRPDRPINAILMEFLPSHLTSGAIAHLAPHMNPGAPLIIELSLAVTDYREIFSEVCREEIPQILSKKRQENPFHCVVVTRDISLIGVPYPLFIDIDAQILQETIEEVATLSTRVKMRIALERALIEIGAFEKLFPISVMYFLLCEYHMKKYAPEMEQFLRNHGFKDISIKRVKRSLYNGRRNVWTINATKGAGLKPILEGEEVDEKRDNG